jgi:hypothetical protein
MNTERVLHSFPLARPAARAVRVGRAALGTNLQPGVAEHRSVGCVIFQLDQTLLVTTVALASDHGIWPRGDGRDARQWTATSQLYDHMAGRSCGVGKGDALRLVRATLSLALFGEIVVVSDKTG